jgi:ribosomal protein S18 acetylase RimI-like enzyme
MKIDKDERPSWGFILEFYIVPDKRRQGLGSRLFTLARKILQDHGAQNIWLLASPPSDSFWRSLGFQETGEIEDDQKVMVLSLPKTS